MSLDPYHPIPGADTPENIALAKAADRVYQEQRAAQAALAEYSADARGIAQCTPDNLYGLSAIQKAVADDVIRNPLFNRVSADSLNQYQRQYIEDEIGQRAAIAAAQKGSPSLKAWDGKKYDPYQHTRAGLELALITPFSAPAVVVVAGASAPVLLPLGLRAGIIVGATGLGVNSAFQMASDEPYKPAEGINAAVTGAMSFGKGVPVSAVVNIAGAYTTARYQGDDPAPKVVGALVGTFAGAEVGKVAAKQVLSAGVAAGFYRAPTLIVAPMVSQTGRDIVNGGFSSTAQEFSGKGVDGLFNVLRKNE